MLRMYACIPTLQSAGMEPEMLLLERSRISTAGSPVQLPADSVPDMVFPVRFSTCASKSSRDVTEQLRAKLRRS